MTARQAQIESYEGREDEVRALLSRRSSDQLRLFRLPPCDLTPERPDQLDRVDEILVGWKVRLLTQDSVREDVWLGWCRRGFLGPEVRVGSPGSHLCSDPRNVLDVVPLEYEGDPWSYNE